MHTQIVHRPKRRIAPTSISSMARSERIDEVRGDDELWPVAARGRQNPARRSSSRNPKKLAEPMSTFWGGRCLGGQRRGDADGHRYGGTTMTTTDRHAMGANLDTPVRHGSRICDPTNTLDSITHEATSTHAMTAATHPSDQARNRAECSACASDTPHASLVVGSDYAVPDLTLDLLAAIVVESAAKGAKTEAA
jgi:hypothetical protein